MLTLVVNLVIILVLIVMVLVVTVGGYIIIVTRCTGVEHDRERPEGSGGASFLIGRTFKPSKGIHTFTHAHSQIIKLNFFNHTFTYHLTKN